MRFISWNVNGLRACVAKGFAEVFDSFDADVVCLQETKLQEGQLDLSFPGYQSFWNFAEKKGYAGTAIYTRRAPESVAYGIGVADHDHEGRVITLSFPSFYLVTCYTPNSQQGLRRLTYRLQWEEAFYHYLTALDKDKPVVVCGDLNVAHEEIDLKNPAANRQNAGFSDDERRQMTRLLGTGFQREEITGTAGGFVDTFRHMHPTAVKYSWWSFRAAARERNIGWRIDYFLVSTRLCPLLTAADILCDIPGSDHCPVLLAAAL